MSKVQDMASGKLYIAGEYAVVDGAAAIVVAVNRYVSATIDDDDLRITDIPVSYTHLTLPTNREV